MARKDRIRITKAVTTEWPCYLIVEKNGKEYYYRGECDRVQYWWDRAQKSGAAKAWTPLQKDLKEFDPKELDEQPKKKSKGIVVNVNGADSKDADKIERALKRKRIPYDWWVLAPEVNLTFTYTGDWDGRRLKRELEQIIDMDFTVGGVSEANRWLRQALEALDD